jgi:hypothetical protein
MTITTATAKLLATLSALVAHKPGVDRSLVVLAACDCARTALRYVPPGEDRPLLAIEAAAHLRAAAAEAAYADYAAHAAARAVAGGAAAEAAVARPVTHRRCADLVRGRIPWAAVEAHCRPR